jgi:hypothetical protein
VAVESFMFTQAMKIHNEVAVVYAPGGGGGVRTFVLDPIQSYHSPELLKAPEYGTVSTTTRTK